MATEGLFKRATDQLLIDCLDHDKRVSVLLPWTNDVGVVTGVAYAHEADVIFSVTGGYLAPGNYELYMANQLRIVSVEG